MTPSLSYMNRLDLWNTGLLFPLKSLKGSALLYIIDRISYGEAL